MGRVLVHRADVDNGRIQRLAVQLAGLPERVIDRDTAVAWMRDGHSFVPMQAGSPAPALVLVELAGDDYPPEVVIRADSDGADTDSLPPLPPV